MVSWCIQVIYVSLDFNFIPYSFEIESHAMRYQRGCYVCVWVLANLLKLFLYTYAYTGKYLSHSLCSWWISMIARGVWRVANAYTSQRPYNCNNHREGFTNTGQILSQTLLHDLLLSSRSSRLNLLPICPLLSFA